MCYCNECLLTAPIPVDWRGPSPSRSWVLSLWGPITRQEGVRVVVLVNELVRWKFGSPISHKNWTGTLENFIILR
jgi:hypothetical protein